MVVTIPMVSKEGVKMTLDTLVDVAGKLSEEDENLVLDNNLFGMEIPMNELINNKEESEESNEKKEDNEDNEEGNEKKEESNENEESNEKKEENVDNVDEENENSEEKKEIEQPIENEKVEEHDEN